MSPLDSNFTLFFEKSLDGWRGSGKTEKEVNGVQEGRKKGTGKTTKKLQKQ